VKVHLFGYAHPRGDRKYAQSTEATGDRARHVAHMTGETERGADVPRDPHTPRGDLYGCQNKGLARTGVCKSMKTKGT
jgi:hypothetical protein